MDMVGLTNAEIMKEKQQLQEEIEILKRQIAEAAKPAQHKTVWANDFFNEFSGADAASLFKECNKEIRELFMYVSERKRKHKKAQFEAVLAMAKEAFEQWTIRRTGNRWNLLHANFVPRDPAKDTNEDILDLEFVHLGYLRTALKDGTPTPEPVNITMHTQFHRYELEG